MSTQVNESPTTTRTRAGANATAAHPSRFFRFGRGVARHPWLAVACWVALLAGSVAVLPRLQGALTGFPLDVIGSDSQRVQDLMRHRFAQSFSEQDLLVFNSDTVTVQDSAYQQVIEDAVGRVAGLNGVVAVISPLDPQAQGQVSDDGHAALAVVGLRGDDTALQALAPKLTAAAKAAATAEVQVYATGNAEVTVDLAKQEESDLDHAEELGLPVALLVLLLAFGSLVAAGLPLLLALVGVTITFGVLSVLAGWLHFDLFVEIIAPMVGLGVGIDYSLFFITRFREELARGEPVADAVARTTATTGATIFFSGLTVIIAMAGLLLVNMKIFSDMALAAMLTVGVMVAAALSLLPAVLALLGRRVNRLALPFARRAVEHPNPERGFWARWARGIMRHPIWWTVASLVVLLAFTAPLAQLRLGLNLGAGALGDEPSGKGLAVLQAHFTQGAIAPIQIVLASDHGTLSDGDLDAVARLTTALRADAAVAEVDSVTALLDQLAGDHSTAALQTAAQDPQVAQALGYLVNLGRGGDLTAVTVVPRTASDANASLDLVRRIRGSIAPAALAGVALRAYVGGFPAQIVDLSDESLRKLAPVVGLVLLLSFLLLTMVFRSLFLPLKAIVMNLMSVGAAYGLLVLVFQEGVGARLFHFNSPGYLQVYLPLFTFALLFGLSMDYEVFLIGRMREEWERGGDNTRAVSRGLQHTARAITSAAAIMVAVFAAFAFTRVVETQEIGFALAAAILVDATIIRVVLVPAAMRLIGHWNWWLPRALERVLPRIALGEGAAEGNIEPETTGNVKLTM